MSSSLGYLAAGWLLYAAIHSLLASHRCKDFVARRWPGAMRYYRLAFNLLAVLLLVPVLALSHAADGDWLWRWQGWLAWVANGLSAAAVAGFVVSARYYDMAEFLGLRQLRGDASAALREGSFVVSPFHRYVRHPWYCFGLVLVWCRDMNPPLLLSALAITAYFVVGSRLEEKKLLATYGAAYEEYRKRVAGLLPWPGRILSAAAAAELARQVPSDCSSSS